MMKRALIPLLFCVAGVAKAQPRAGTPVRPVISTVATLPGVLVDEALPAPGTNRIYYVTDKGELFLYDRVNKRSTPIAPGEVSGFALSPLRDRIAFARHNEDKTESHIWAIPLDPAKGAATGPARRVSVMTGGFPKFSPDGQQIAFAWHDSSMAALVVMPASGGAERVLTRMPGQMFRIHWSTDGQSISFSVGTMNHVASYRVAVSGGAAVPVSGLVSRSGERELTFPSPNGQLNFTITAPSFDSTYVSDGNGKRLGAFPNALLEAVDGVPVWNGNVRVLGYGSVVPRRLRTYSLVDGTTRALTDSNSQVLQAHWSPDGRRIFVALPDSKLAIMNADGSGMRTIALNAVPVYNCYWSPDSRWIAVARQRDVGRVDLLAIEVANGREVALAKGLNVTEILYTLQGRWASDSRSLIYAAFVDSTAGKPTGARFVLHEATLTGGDRTLQDVTNYVSGTWPASFGISTIVYKNRNEEWITAPLRAAAPGNTLYPASVLGLSGPSFSGDGGRVAFRLNPKEKGNSSFPVLEVMQVDGSGREKINVPFSAVPGIHNPMFLPDPRQVLVAGQDIGQPRRNADVSFYVVSMDGGAVKKLLTIPRTKSEPWGWRFDYDYDLSPDGKTLLYITEGAGYSTFTDVDLSGYLKLLPTKKSP